MKNILLIAKVKALQENSECVKICHLQTALNNVTIRNEKVRDFIYKFFGASYLPPEAHYTQAILEDKKLKKAITYDEHLKHILMQLKNKEFSIDIMNISKLNRLEELEASYLEFAENICNAKDEAYGAAFYNFDYIYDPSEAINELGLSEQLVYELVEDYVEQILRTYGEFKLYLSALWECRFLDQPLDYTPLRDLAHKNLGVAKNLRIEDGIALLKEIKNENDLDKISRYLNLLISRTIKLKPKKACEAMFDSVEELKRFQKFYSNKEKILQTIKN
ncbi:hypothetical protein [Sulfurimonas sp. HSL-1716]|uniref:hypothetical protein n=1 Tax=Hydrocurvibacter sulfurireducens TaxID=3131937 RepID=UPI0031F74C87